MPLHNIQETPIAVFYGDADRVCPMDQTEWMMGRVGKMVYGNYQFGGYSHADFGIANDHVFMNELHEALSHLRPYDEPQEKEEDFPYTLEGLADDDLEEHSQHFSHFLV